jgi:hypothetical protein
MARRKTRMNPDEVGKLLKSPEVVRDLRRRVNNIAAAAGPGFLASVVVGRHRARGSVITATQQARAAEARNRALTKALDRGRS